MESYNCDFRRTEEADGEQRSADTRARVALELLVFPFTSEVAARAGGVSDDGPQPRQTDLSRVRVAAQIEIEARLRRLFQHLRAMDKQDLEHAVRHCFRSDRQI